ncbi:MAG: hypothetical protein OEV44_00945 [Spirochaetota bacterium]|nr:hypothetical protein [Spirochaetota bacterium]
MFYAITLIFLGILAVPSLIISRKPEAKETLDKIVPYQGYIGVGFCLWGIWTLIDSLIHIRVISIFPILWITWLAAGLLLAALGFILGYGLISKYALSKSPEAQKKGDELLAKLAPIQGKLGIAAIILGIWFIIARIIWWF